MDLNGANRVGYVGAYVSVEAAPFVGRTGRNPIDQVNLEALAHEKLDDAAAGLEVEDEGALEERVDKQQRHAMLHPGAARLVVTQTDQARFVDDARARCGRRVIHRRAEAGAKRIERAHRAFHPERSDLVNGRHLCRSPPGLSPAIPATPKIDKRWISAPSPAIS